MHYTIRHPDRVLRFLALLSLMSLVMLAVRCAFTQTSFLLLLGWNLFLAWIPLLITCLMPIRQREGGSHSFVFWPSLAIWLLFLPNSPYIITDLFHVRVVAERTLWFDTMMIFMFALTGLLAGMYSLLLVHRLLNERVGQLWAWTAVLICLVLTSFGVYLGRYGRWNSWDLFTDPIVLIKAIMGSIAEPVALKLTLSYTFALVVPYVSLIAAAGTEPVVGMFRRSIGRST